MEKKVNQNDNHQEYARNKIVRNKILSEYFDWKFEMYISDDMTKIF